MTRTHVCTYECECQCEGVRVRVKRLVLQRTTCSDQRGGAVDHLPRLAMAGRKAACHAGAARSSARRRRQILNRIWNLLLGTIHLLIMSAMVPTYVLRFLNPSCQTEEVCACSTARCRSQPLRRQQGRTVSTLIVTAELRNRQSATKNHIARPRPCRWAAGRIRGVRS